MIHHNDLRAGMWLEVQVAREGTLPLLLSALPGTRSARVKAPPGALLRVVALHPYRTREKNGRRVPVTPLGFWVEVATRHRTLGTHMRVWSLDLVWHVKEVEPLAEQPFPELPPYEIPEQDRDLWGVGCVLSPPREGSAPGCGEQTGR